MAEGTAVRESGAVDDQDLFDGVDTGSQTPAVAAAVGISDLHSSNEPVARTVRPTLRGHIAIARPDHWVKQVFVLPGISFALASTSLNVTGHTVLSIVAGSRCRLLGVVEQLRHQ